MAHNPIVGFRTKLATNDGASQAFADFEGLSEVSLPARSIDMVDVTPLDQSTNYKQYLPNLLCDGGILKFSVFYSSENNTRLEALFGKRFAAAGVAVKWKITPTDPDGSASALGKVYTLDGILKTLGEVSFTKGNDAPMIPCEVQVNAWSIADASQGSGTP